MMSISKPNNSNTPNIYNDQQNTVGTPAIRAYLGGSFDPVHNGHLEVAMSVYQCLLPLAAQQQRALHVSLLPNARSPFKAHSTDPSHRLAMLTLATQGTPIQINELELWQPPPVYTIDSVRTLRQRYPNDTLIFIMGMDSARSLDKWKDGLQLTDYVDLWVFNRQNDSAVSDIDIAPTATSTALPIKRTEPLHNKSNLAAQLPIPLQPYVIDSPAALLEAGIPSLLPKSACPNLKTPSQGRIYIDLRPITAVSSTQIRQQLIDMSNKTAGARKQIASVASINDIIDNTHANPLTKWLNPAVYRYIIAHQLYSAAQFR